ncbi:hypothetical protein RRX38_22885 [Pseudomonas sp. DTU_2021_1001937_2_SI_NGA_ILE_001]|uniref:hypothetical protein n=1 Tax=Pseudomonas sp. DTU_2021_1001937_2_SI_NGA_ILE_001 TaxID=3077589 RepID=UPI0028FC2FDD|nr:hypothetical protein [Pseudomonas sp. DTU_2021_1001937_2_SI_NGA_ILE_001]WNW13879.1 hypothetical protein RRX38_22885 [Pseudomonas sp. DTU_2021_1001937_2_SI_NGA_ILE_001]
MTNPPHTDPLAGLSDSLSADYHASQSAQRDREVAELKKLIEAVPEQTEFTNSRRWKTLGPLFVLIAVVFLVMGLKNGSTGLAVFMLVLALLFMLVTWQHRDSGQKPFMKLTRRQVIVDTLSAPVELVDVEDILVKDEGLITLQKLTLRPGANLPVHRARFQLFGNQAMALKKPQPHIRINSAGLMTGGRKIGYEEMAAILNAYWQAAAAQQQLDVLQRRG